MIHKSARFILLLTLLALFAVNTPPHLSAQPSASLTPSTAIRQSSTGPAPIVAGITPLSHDEFSSRDTVSFRDGLMSPLAAIGKAAFALELYPDEKIRYIPNADTPGEWIYVGGIEGRAYYAGDFVGRDYSQIYVLDYDLNELHTVNTSTGVTSTIGASNPLLGHAWTGATGTAGGVLYASSTYNSMSYLYKVNTSTGAATAVGQITNAPEIIDIAINTSGQMYGVDIANDNLVRINRFTGAGTVIGPIGFSANYAQGMVGF